SSCRPSPPIPTMQPSTSWSPTTKPWSASTRTGRPSAGPRSTSAGSWSACGRTGPTACSTCLRPNNTPVVWGPGADTLGGEEGTQRTRSRQRASAHRRTEGEAAVGEIWDGDDAEERVRRLGLPGSQVLVDAIGYGAAAARTVTAQHPANYRGIRLW